MSESASANERAGIEFRRGYVPGVIGRVGELHGRYYASAWGVGAGFELMMTREFCDFIEHYDPENDLLLSAYIDAVLAGSIAILGNPGPEGAQLRFFLVDPQYQGRGAGKALLNAALNWCRARRFPKMFLWTVDHLPQSRRLYEQAGFRVVLQCTDDRYTAPLESLKMELAQDLDEKCGEAGGCNPVCPTFLHFPCYSEGAPQGCSLQISWPFYDHANRIRSQFAPPRPA